MSDEQMPKVFRDYLQPEDMVRFYEEDGKLVVETRRAGFTSKITLKEEDAAEAMREGTNVLSKINNSIVDMIMDSYLKWRKGK